ncbi:META domain-containing protein [Oxalobacteraceae sp. CFBP 13730]|nr:META domain-containing protein [Oxalobacteraceae sp. CFBP 13730]
MRSTLCILSVSLALGACSSTPASSTAAMSGNPSAAPSLEGTSWRLASFQSNDDGSQALRPGTPDGFTLTFNKDGRLAVKLDCNRGNGPWQAVATDAMGGTLSMGPVATTRAMCPPDAIGTRLAQDLPALRTWRLQDNRLQTGLPADAGVYVWERITP